MPPSTSSPTRQPPPPPPIIPAYLFAPPSTPHAYCAADIIIVESIRTRAWWTADLRGPCWLLDGSVCYLQVKQQLRKMKEKVGGRSCCVCRRHACVGGAAAFL